MALRDFVKRRLGRPKHEPHRDTIQFPNFYQVGRTNNLTGLAYKATPRNLRYFSRTPFPRRAINAIKNPIKMLDWEICPIDGVELNSELKRQIEVTTNCFNYPNNYGDDFQSLLEQLLEDYLISAGTIETQIGGDPNFPLRMYPVDGLSIQIHPDWKGDPNSARYAQTSGYGTEFGGGEIIHLRDDELLYLRPNPNTASPFGYAPLEIAFLAITRLLATGEFAGNVAGNAKPNFGIDWQGLQPEQLNAMRAWWRNEIEGQGQTPFFATAAGADGKAGGVKVLRFYPDGDDALYLKYQEMLIKELGVAFDLSPQNFGIERDVNRSTSEVAEDRDWDAAIKPAAHDIAKAFTRHCIQGRLGFSQLRFRFKSLDREDEVSTWKIFETRYKNNTITPNEIRKVMGETPMENAWADRTFADMEVAMNAARSASQVLDPDLTDGMVLPAPKPPEKKSK